MTATPDTPRFTGAPCHSLAATRLDSETRQEIDQNARPRDETVRSVEHGRDAVGDEHGGAEDARDRDVPDHVLGGHRDEPNSPEDESQEHSRSGSFPPARDDGFLVPISGPTEEALCPNSGGFGAQSFGVTLRNGERGAVILKENSGTISLVLRWREGGHYRSRAIACFGHVRPSLHRPETPSR